LLKGADRRALSGIAVQHANDMAIPDVEISAVRLFAVRF